MSERIECAVEEIEMESELTGRLQDGVRVTCKRCGHFVEVFGTSERSIKRGLVTLREECPEGEENFYVDEDD